MGKKRRRRRRRRTIGKQMFMVSKYEKVTSVLLALNLFIGFMDGIMLVMWISGLKAQAIEAVPVLILEPKGRGANAEGYERDPEEPGLEEVEEISEPRIEETFLAVTDTVTNTAASLVALNTGATSSSHGSGLGDSRGAGPGGDGDLDVVPRQERWRISLSANSVDSFERQLAYFKIDLAAFGGGITTLDSTFHPISPANVTHLEDGTQEKRTWFYPQNAIETQWTAELLNKAGIPTSGRTYIHLYSPESEQKLLVAEDARMRAANKRIDEVKRTYFEVRASGGQYEFVVTNQEYRPAPNYNN